MQISGDLRDMETEAARMQTQIDDGRSTKRDTLGEIVEVERQVCEEQRSLCLLGFHAFVLCNYDCASTADYAAIPVLPLWQRRW